MDLNRIDSWFSKPSGKNTRMESKLVNRKILPEKYEALLPMKQRGVGVEQRHWEE